MNIRELFNELYKHCECGCKYLIPIINKKGEPARFAHGHNGRVIGTGINNSNWKGGRYKDSNGYWIIYLPSYYRSDKSGHVKEHIYFYESYHKLCMLPWGHVHHIIPVTKDYCNNMIWNLQGVMARDHVLIHLPKGKPKKKKDFSKRFCSKCGSKTTLKNDKKNYFYWFKNGNEGYWCNICYEKNRRQEKKLKVNTTISNYIQ